MDFICRIIEQLPPEVRVFRDYRTKKKRRVDVMVFRVMLAGGSDLEFLLVGPEARTMKQLPHDCEYGISLRLFNVSCVYEDGKRLFESDYQITKIQPFRGRWEKAIYELSDSELWNCAL